MQLPTIDEASGVSTPASIANESAEIEQRTNNVFKTVICVLVTVFAAAAFLVGLHLHDDSSVKEVLVITGAFMTPAGALGTALQIKRTCCPHLCQENIYR